MSSSVSVYSVFFFHLFLKKTFRINAEVFMGQILSELAWKQCQSADANWRQLSHAFLMQNRFVLCSMSCCLYVCLLVMTEPYKNEQTDPCSIWGQTHVGHRNAHALQRHLANMIAWSLLSDDAALWQIPSTICSECVFRLKKKDKESGVSRGIDFQNVSNIVNFDFPPDVNSYIHRVGRSVVLGWWTVCDHLPV